MSTRSWEYLCKIPIVTLGLVILNCAVHAVIFLSSTGISGLSISAIQVIGGEYYRIVTSVFVHGGIIHIFMNMTSLLQLGSSLEMRFGSMQFLLLTMWSILLTGALYVQFSW